MCVRGSGGTGRDCEAELGKGAIIQPRQGQHACHPSYGLAGAGEPGVAQVLEMLRAEIERTMILIGAASVRDLSPERVRLSRVRGHDAG